MKKYKLEFDGKSTIVEWSASQFLAFKKNICVYDGGCSKCLVEDCCDTDEDVTITEVKDIKITDDNYTITIPKQLVDDVLGAIDRWLK